MNVNDKIKQILIDKSLSPSVFADEIGVQRSSISHILSGRNRPSFDIIQKVIRRFPDLGYDWIMEDESQEGTPFPKAAAPIRSARETSQPQSPRDTLFTSRQQIPRASSPSLTPAASITTAPESPTAKISVDKTVERILIFYTDGTFKEYMPAG